MSHKAPCIMKKENRDESVGYLDEESNKDEKINKC